MFKLLKSMFWRHAENDVPPHPSIEGMSFTEILEHVAGLHGPMTMEHTSALTKRLYEIALYDNHVQQEDREGASKLLESLKASAEDVMRDNAQALEAYRAANAFMEENARRFGVGSLGWLIEERRVPPDKVVEFIANPEYSHLLSDFFSVLEPKTVEHIKVELEQYLRSR